MTRILVIEDEVEMAEVLKDLLELSGYRASIALNGRDGLAAAFSEPPDLVLTDIMLPYVDGRQVIARLRENETTRHVPIVAMSASEGVAHRPFLRKPFAADELLRVVETELRGHR